MAKISMFSSRTTDDQEVTLGEAFKYIDEVPKGEYSTSAFIGFVNEKKEIIQFARYDTDRWLFDIPIQDLHTNEWKNELLQLDNISTAIVKRIVETFFTDLDLVQKTYSKYRKEDTKEVDDRGVTYYKIDPAFIHWIEKHRSDELYS